MMTTSSESSSGRFFTELNSESAHTEQGEILRAQAVEAAALRLQSGAKQQIYKVT